MIAWIISAKDLRPFETQEGTCWGLRRRSDSVVFPDLACKYQYLYSMACSVPYHTSMSCYQKNAMIVYRIVRNQKETQSIRLILLSSSIIRSYACGAFISQTGGHGDTGCCFDQPGDFDLLEKVGFAHICKSLVSILLRCYPLKRSSRC